MKTIRIKILIGFLLVLPMVILTVLVTKAANNEFLWGELRYDLIDVHNAEGYQEWIRANIIPIVGPPDYTVGWLGVYLAQGNGQTYSAQFSQVGLMTQSDGLKWFVYAEPGVTCLGGHQSWGTRGCIGDVGQLPFVGLGFWHQVQLVNYGAGYWIARIADTNGNLHDVALIWTTSSTIYRAMAVMEEYFSEVQNPYLAASFDHNLPQYMVYGNNFQDWPTSDNTKTSYVYTTDLQGNNTICPQHYGMTPNLLNDERKWFTGTGGQKCWWLLFPSVHIYLPTIVNNS